MIKKLILISAIMFALPINIASAASEANNQSQSLNNIQLAYTIWDKRFKMRSRVNRHGVRPRKEHREHYNRAIYSQ